MNNHKYNMSRQKPTVLNEITDKSTYKTDQVLAADGIWAIYYCGDPISIKTHNMLIQYPGPKYKKTTFTAPGHAISMAKKLNTQFKTTDFTVVQLSQASQVYP